MPTSTIHLSISVVDRYIKISQKICWDIWGRNRQRNCNCRSILSWCRVCQCRHGSSCPHTQFNWAVLSNQPPTISYPWGWSKHCIKILLLNRCNWWVVWNCAPPSKKGYIQEDEALWIRMDFIIFLYSLFQSELLYTSHRLASTARLSSHFDSRKLRAKRCVWETTDVRTWMYKTLSRRITEYRS